MNKTEKAAQRRQAILQAAGRLALRYGFDKTTMDDIAREAGVSKGALYLVWDSKDALFDALINDALRQYLEDFQARLAADADGGQIARMYRHALLALQANALVSALYRGDNQILGDFIKRQDPRRYTQRLLLSEQAIRQLQAAGSIRADIDPSVLSYLFSMLALGFVHINALMPPEAQPPLEQLADGLSAVVHSGFAGPGQDSQAGKQALNELSATVAAQYRREA